MSKENDEEKYAIDKQKLRQAFNGIHFIYIIFFTVQLNRGVIPGCVLKPNSQDWGLSGGVGYWMLGVGIEHSKVLFLF